MKEWTTTYTGTIIGSYRGGSLTAGQIRQGFQAGSTTNTSWGIPSNYWTGLFTFAGSGVDTIFWETGSEYYDDVVSCTLTLTRSADGWAATTPRVRWMTSQISYDPSKGSRLNPDNYFPGNTIATEGDVNLYTGPSLAAGSSVDVPMLGTFQMAAMAGFVLGLWAGVRTAMPTQSQNFMIITTAPKLTVKWRRYGKIKVKNGGSWSLVPQRPWVRPSGTWVKGSVWVKVNGEWQLGKHVQ